METVVFALMMLVCFNYVLKQTYRKPAGVAISTAACTLFTGLMWPMAVEQSMTQISDWLADSALMLDLAVVLTVEVALNISYCLLAVHVSNAGVLKPRTVRLYKLLRWFPGILIYPVLFSLLVRAVFALPGVSFPLVSWGLAAMVAIVVPVGTFVLKKLLPEKDIRLEVHFLLNIFIAVLGIVATVNGRTAVAGVSEVNWGALAGVLALVAGGIVLGALFYKVKNKKVNKKQIML